MMKVAGAQGDLDYVLFVLLRYWVPPILPPAGKERMVKGDADYWIESERILKQAVRRMRELRPFLQMLTESHPGPESARADPAAVRRSRRAARAGSVGAAGGDRRGGGPAGGGRITLPSSRVSIPHRFARSCTSATTRSTAPKSG